MNKMPCCSRLLPRCGLLLVFLLLNRGPLTLTAFALSNDDCASTAHLHEQGSKQYPAVGDVPSEVPESVVNAVAKALSASSNVLMQGFNWDSAANPIGWYTVLKLQLRKICGSGVTSIWLPPPSQSGDEGTASKRHGYQPQNWYNLTSDYGSARELEDLLRGLRACGIKPIADIVINHRQAVEQVSGACSCAGCPGATWTLFKNPDWTSTEVVSDAGSPCGACHQCNLPNCCPQGGTIFCGKGNADTGDHFCSFPDIDHTSPKVQNDVIEWLNWLKVGDFSGEQRVAPGEALGFQGWRFDLVKGYAPWFIRKYLENTGSDWAVGEYFDYDQPDKIMDWVHGTGDKAVAFDFPLRKTLKLAIEGDDFSGLGYGMSSVTSRDSWKAVPFTDNHDTARVDSGGGGWPWGSTSTGTATENVLAAYAYILSHPSNTPVVFWSDWSDRGLEQPIKALIALRTAAGISGGSSIYVDQHQPRLYTARVTGSLGELLVKLGSTYPWTPSDTSYWGFTPYLSGKNWAIWWHKGIAA